MIEADFLASDASVAARLARLVPCSSRVIEIRSSARVDH
jgi:hypothetical protein